MIKQFLTAATLLISIISCNSSETNADKIMQANDSVTVAKTMAIKFENVDYTDNGVTLKGFVAYPEDSTTTKPAVLIVPEWWGISDYTRGRAKQLAELGYVALAVDFYGNGKTADNPTDAQNLATPFYAPNNTIGQKRFEAALAKIKTIKGVDTTKIAAIGYCFGGAMVINMARLGEPLKGVVSFHGNLLANKLDKSKLKADMLICSGDADPFVPALEVTTFKKQMDSVGASYKFIGYPNATHAFTNPAATAIGAKFKIPISYNAAADTASFKEMIKFFDKIFK